MLITRKDKNKQKKEKEKAKEELISLAKSSNVSFMSTASIEDPNTLVSRSNNMEFIGGIVTNPNAIAAIMASGMPDHIKKKLIGTATLKTGTKIKS